MKEYYFFLDSKATTTRNNKFYDFTVDFPYTLFLGEKQWEIGLAEVSFFKKNVVSPDLYLCCDKISPSFKNNETAQIIRFIPGVKGRAHFSFNPIYYFGVLGNTIKTIRMYINTTSSTIESFEGETLYCTLHLREKNSNYEVHT